MYRFTLLAVLLTVSVAVLIIPSSDAVAIPVPKAEAQAKAEAEPDGQGLRPFKRAFRTQQEPCACPRMYWPVCGSDDVTYSNECTFNCTAKTRSNLFIKTRNPCGSKNDEYDDLDSFIY